MYVDKGQISLYIKCSFKSTREKRLALNKKWPNIFLKRNLHEKYKWLIEKNIYLY